MHKPKCLQCSVNFSIRHKQMPDSFRQSIHNYYTLPAIRLALKFHQIFKACLPVGITLHEHGVIISSPTFPTSYCDATVGAGDKKQKKNAQSQSVASTIDSANATTGHKMLSSKSGFCATQTFLRIVLKRAPRPVVVLQIQRRCRFLCSASSPASQLSNEWQLDGSWSDQRSMRMNSAFAKIPKLMARPCHLVRAGTMGSAGLWNSGSQLFWREFERSC